PYIKQVASSSLFPGVLNDPYGGLLLANCGYVDIPAMLSGWKAWMVDSGLYMDERFDEPKLDIRENSIRYGDLEAEKIVFCQGNGAVNSHYFGWLPFRPVKGEVLTVTAGAEAGTIYNRGVFMLPRGNGRFRVGATYDWRNLNTEPTEEAKQELLERLGQLCPLPVTVEEQVAGVRPATKDRRPFLGVHPEHPRLAIFNGLGTKGVSLAPYFGRQMADFLGENKEIQPEVNISRYLSLYFR
ncbi:MAG: FAD-dependent oxidoreductase, partial [Cyclobacteriaceae bacterium]